MRFHVHGIVPITVILAAAAACAAAPGVMITDLSIDVTLDPEHGVLEEEAAITVSGSGPGPLEFRLGRDLRVERVRSAGGVAEFVQSGTRVRVTIDPPLDGERVLRFRITGRPRRGAVDLVTKDWAALGSSDHWYPTMPGSAARVVLRIHVPDGWTALGPGRPHRRDGEPTEWRSKVRLRGVAIAAAPGLRIRQTDLVRNTLRVAAPGEGLEVGAIAAMMADPFAWMFGALGPFPYDGFNLALVPGLAVRVQGSGFLAVPLDTPLGGRADAAALLAGQWWGEILGGDGPWIDAFAAWQAVTYARDRTEPLPQEIASLRDEYLLSGQTGDVPVARAVADSPPRVVRGKGSAAVDMIRIGVGDRPFFRAIREVFGLAGPAPVSLGMVEERFRDVSGETVMDRFRQWFHRTGVPELSAEFRSMPAAGGGWRVDLRLIQGGEPYTLPIDVVFRSVADEHRERIEIRDASTAVFYLLQIEAVRAEIDPLGAVFMLPVRWPRQ